VFAAAKCLNLVTDGQGYEITVGLEMHGLTADAWNAVKKEWWGEEKEVTKCV
jgi:hypothetical protein